MGVGGSRAVTPWAVTCSRTEPHLQNDATACCVQHLPHKIEAAAHNHAESSCQYQLQDFSLIELYSKFTLFTDSKNHDLYCPWIDWLMMDWFLQKQVFILMLSWAYEFPRVYCENADFDSVRMKFHILKELSGEDAAVDHQTLTLTKQNEVCFSSPPSYDV